MAEAGNDLGFSLYSPGHMIWLAVIVAAAWLISIWYRGMESTHIWGGSNAIEPPYRMRSGARAGGGRRTRIRKVFAIVLALSEVYKDSVLAITGNFRAEYLPYHLCGIAIFVILVDAFVTRQRVTGQLIAYAFMPGAISALLFCNWTEYPFLNFMNIHSFLFHGWIVCYMVMQFRCGEIRPNYRGIWQTAGLMAVLAVPLFWFNRAYGTNFMFLNEASEGSPLVILWDLFGTKYGHLGYLAAAAVMVIAIFHILWLIYCVIGSGMKNRGKERE